MARTDRTPQAAASAAPKYWKGFLWGFLFGTVGVWLLAALSLISQVFEVITAPLFAPGRFFASILVGSDASTFATVGLFALTGIFYGLIGVLLQFLARAFRAQAKTV